jgi:hypothetical protein
VRSGHVRSSRGPVSCTCSLLRLSEHPQVPAFDRTLQINTIEPMASGRCGRGWGSQTTVRGSAVGRRPVCAGHEKYGKESNQSDPSSETRKHGCDQVALRESDWAAKPAIIHADTASRTVHLSASEGGYPSQSRFDCVFDATHGLRDSARAFPGFSASTPQWACGFPARRRPVAIFTRLQVWQASICRLH